jgi:putative peptidoglycan lipid II flippase
VLVIALPASLGLALLAEPVLATLLERGNFLERDTLMAAASLRACAPGLAGFILVKVLAPGYFARQDTRTPMKIGIAALGLSMGLDIVFVLLLLRTQWAPAHVGIAASSACAAVFNAACLLAGLARSKVYRPRAGWRGLWVQAVAGNIAMAVALLAALHRFGDWSAMGELERIGSLALLIGGGAAVYFAVAFGLGLRPRALRARVA